MNFDPKEKGFMLIDVVVASGIFITVMAIVAGIFVSEINTQRRIYGSFLLQNEGNFLMQKISKEIRMSKSINSNQEGNNDSSLEFVNYNSELTEYCQSDSSGICMSGTYVARNGIVISSPEITVESLKFITSDSFASNQPLITVILKIKSADGAESLMLQNSLATRTYN